MKIYIVKKPDTSAEFVKKLQEFLKEAGWRLDTVDPKVQYDARKMGETMPMVAGYSIMIIASGTSEETLIDKDTNAIPTIPA